MPLVVPKSGFVQYVRHEAVVAEILGHDNFDGEDWAVGDRAAKRGRSCSVSTLRSSALVQ